MLIVHRIVSAASLAGLARNHSARVQAALLCECSTHHNYSRDVLKSSDSGNMGQRAHKLVEQVSEPSGTQCYGHVNMVFSYSLTKMCVTLTAGLVNVPVRLSGAA
jgi:hypothetical protein